MNFNLSEKVKLRIILSYILALFLLGLLVDKPGNIIKGIGAIVLSPDLLITDYLGVGGIGATFFNAGFLALSGLIILKFNKVKLNGASIAALFTVIGFSLFGKDILNVWPIIIGVWLYSLYQRETFGNFVIIALFGTTLSPMVSQFVYFSGYSYWGYLAGILAGITAGFILPPVAAHLLRTHQGFNLYNIGFTGGIIGTIYVSVFRSYGFDTAKQFVWTTEYTEPLAIFLLIYFLSMIVLGCLCDRGSLIGLKNIWKKTGRAITDFTISEGFFPTLINMGLMGILYTLFVLVMGFPLNGPTVGGIFTIVGFSAFGKHPLNTLPVVLGVVIGGIIKLGGLNEPSFIIAALFSTTLAPISGFFGFLSGTFAGFLHLSVVMMVGYLHGGLNLYNNGFAGGIVAAFLFPILDSIRKDEQT